MTKEEREAIKYFKEKVKNKVPEYKEINVNGAKCRINYIPLETNFSAKTASKMEIILNLIEKQEDCINRLKDEMGYTRQIIEPIDPSKINIQEIEQLNPNKIYFKDGTELIYKLMYDKLNEIIRAIKQLDKQIKEK